MSSRNIPMPHILTPYAAPLHHVETVIVNHVSTIEAWFRRRWLETPAPITSSVDLRHAGFKLAPVDTNLFPAGFNNLNRDFLPMCIQAAQSVLMEYLPTCTKILILPESHTRNQFYMQSLKVLQDIFVKAGFVVRIASLDDEMLEPVSHTTQDNETVLIEPLSRQGNRVGLKGFDPCLLLLNNDLSSGVPAILQGIEQSIVPTPALGWASRLKSSHFGFYDEVARDFAKNIDIDPWLINPMFSAVDGVDFMSQTGLEILASEVDKLLEQISDKYISYGIKEAPFVAVKADNGTYGMSVMMVYDGAALLQLNRKQRTKMSASKGSQKVTKILIQEGISSCETMPDGAVAEPVVYMMGQFVIGGFYRVHQGRGKDENLNAPGMHFEPLAFASACNTPCGNSEVLDSANRFYVYGVIARLAALAAAREAAALKEV